MPAGGDIETRGDCERLVAAFYDSAMADPMIGYLFTDVAQLDLDKHLPVIASFWETVLLGAQTYAGGAFAVHATLDRKSPLHRAHFERWLVLWGETVDELFAGPTAELAKQHALCVAAAFHRRLAAGREAAPPPGAGGLAVTRHGPRAA
ncbi:MAG: group III truncated hemoglobin [Solirubrobacterales bacterium]